MEPGDLRVANVNANVRWGERELSIAGLDLPYGARLTELKVDLLEWSNDAAAVAVLCHSQPLRAFHVGVAARRGNRVDGPVLPSLVRALADQLAPLAS